jgi:hypothetical protein
VEIADYAEALRHADAVTADRIRNPPLEAMVIARDSMDEKGDFMGMINFYAEIQRNSIVFKSASQLPCVSNPNI